MLAIVCPLALIATTAHPQRFAGGGPHATAAFELASGVVTFEFAVEGDRPYTLRLLGTDEGTVDTLARGTAPVRGSRALRIARTGRYLLDIDAAGEWQIAFATPEAAPSVDASPAHTDTRKGGAGARATEGAEGGAAGDAAARGESTLPWLLGGLAGGAALGPLGAGAVYVMATAKRDAVPVERDTALVGRSPAYVAAYQEAFRRHRRADRRMAAAVGGITGTVIFGFVIAQIVNWSNESGGKNGGNGELP